LKFVLAVNCYAILLLIISRAELFFGIEKTCKEALVLVHFLSGLGGTVGMNMFVLHFIKDM
jgi:hypothetical protein